MKQLSSLGMAMLLSVILCAQSTPGSAATPSPQSPRVVEPFDAGWKFLQSDAPGAQAAAFDDA
jgi:hypothetical protein